MAGYLTYCSRAIESQLLFVVSIVFLQSAHGKPDR